MISMESLKQSVRFGLPVTCSKSVNSPGSKGLKYVTLSTQNHEVLFHISKLCVKQK